VGQVLHHFESAVEFIRPDVADANSLADVCYEGNSLLTVAMFDGIFATLPG
jgi:hypothetical protein